MSKSFRWVWVVMAVVVIGAIFASRKASAPVQITCRRSGLDSCGIVLQIHNTRNHSLSCRVAMENKTLNEATSCNTDIGPWKTSEIGILEAGWSFKTGERVHIDVEGFQSFAFTVP